MRTATLHDGPVRPLTGPHGWVRVDGHPICSVCGRGVQLTGPDKWRHARAGERDPARSKWLAPVTLQRLRQLNTYEDFAVGFPWAVRADFGGPSVTTKTDWREGLRRLERYDAEFSVARQPRNLAPDENPFLDVVRILSAPGPLGGNQTVTRDGSQAAASEWALSPGLYQMLDLSQRRSELASSFAWAIPSDPALDLLASHAPLLECGAGTGYWAALLRARGVDVVAYDVNPPGSGTPNRFHITAKPWSEVRHGPSVAAVRQHSDRLLFLCWPPLDDDDASYAPLRAYRGDRLLFAGEGGEEGVTGSLRFQRELQLNWTLEHIIELPRWPWLSDRLMVFRRNHTRRPLAERDRCFACQRFVPTGWIGRCDWCFEHRPVGIALRVGDQRVEYPHEMLASMPPALRIALENSPSRIR